MVTIFILSVSSDIGLELAKRYLEEGYRVVGTYRDYGKLREIENQPNLFCVKCDIANRKDIERLADYFEKNKIIWDTFISLPCVLTPLTNFFASNFEEWVSSVHINSVEQLRVLHSLYHCRNKKTCANVVFFAAGGVNKAVVDFSAYTIGKIMLIKMCEYLDAENKGLNIFIVGPGFTKTKVHNQVLKDKFVSKEKYQETIRNLKTKKGTSMQDIYDCINFLIKQGKTVSSGRNFSVVYDCWKGRKQELLVRALKKDRNMYKLRRYKNDFIVDK